ncbi:MAG: AraC family transcriptional regulator [Elusimicrobia bacterium]|nr:AraC family transcriptional regulator [Elusimicrobiota bacterium]
MKPNKHHFPFPEKDFPFFISTTIADNTRSKFYHLHPFTLEFHYFRFGNGFYFIKDKRYPIKPKSLFIIHGNDIHTYIKAKNPLAVSKTTLFFSNSLLKSFPSLQPLMENIITCHKNFSHQIHINEKEIIDVEFIVDILQKEWNSKGYNYREIIKTALVLFLMLVKRCKFNEKNVIGSVEKHNPIIDEILDYIDKHLKEHITLSNVSEHVGYSPNYVSHLFNKFTGLGLNEFIDNKRVLEAKRILETDHSKKIISVAFEVGFINLSTFNLNFKRLTGTAPSLYRNFFTSIRK